MPRFVLEVFNPRTKEVLEKAMRDLPTCTSGPVDYRYSLFCRFNHRKFKQVPKGLSSGKIWGAAQDFQRISKCIIPKVYELQVFF